MSEGNAMQQQLKAYLHETLAAQGRPAADVAADALLIEEGVLDSLLLLDFVLRIERRCNIKIPGEDIVPEHFGSLDVVATYLRERFGRGDPQ
jgi:acyl carrier protein